MKQAKLGMTCSIGALLGVLFYGIVSSHLERTDAPSLQLPLDRRNNEMRGREHASAEDTSERVASTPQEATDTIEDWRVAIALKKSSLGQLSGTRLGQVKERLQRSILEAACDANDAQSRLEREDGQALELYRRFLEIERGREAMIAALTEVERGRYLTGSPNELLGRLVAKSGWVSYGLTAPKSDGEPAVAVIVPINLREHPALANLRRAELDIYYAIAEESTQKFNALSETERRLRIQEHFAAKAEIARLRNEQGAPPASWRALERNLIRGPIIIDSESGLLRVIRRND